MYEIISSITSIIIATCGLSAVIAAVVAYVQYKKQTRDKMRDINYEKKKCACDMAYLFAEEIIPLASSLKNIIKESDSDAYEQLFRIFLSNEIADFDEAESIELLSKSEHDQDYVEKALYEVKPEVICKAKMSLCKNEHDRSVLYNHYMDNSVDNDTENSAQKIALLYSDYRLMQSSLLNKIEWFSMVFHYGIADEETVYQSLHQAFLSTVNLMYFRIASHNTYAPNKYYTNLIWLYNHWSERLITYQRDQKQREREAKSHIHTASSVE